MCIPRSSQLNFQSCCCFKTNQTLQFPWCYVRNGLIIRHVCQPITSTPLVEVFIMVSLKQHHSDHHVTCNLSDDITETQVVKFYVWRFPKAHIMNMLQAINTECLEFRWPGRELLQKSVILWPQESWTFNLNHLLHNEVQIQQHNAKRGGITHIFPNMTHFGLCVVANKLNILGAVKLESWMKPQNLRASGLCDAHR